MMRSFCKGRSVRFCRQEIETAVNLKGVGTDNFGFYLAREIGRQLGFACCSWADDKKRAPHPVKPSCVLLIARGLDDLGEAPRIQAGPADEGAIDVGLAH